MVSLMKLFTKADTQDWLTTLVGPAALFSRSGQIVATNDAFTETYRRSSIDPLLSDLLDAAGAFRTSKAVRRGQVLDETFEDLHVRVGPIGSLSLVRLYRAGKVTTLGTPHAHDTPKVAPRVASLQADATSFQTGVAQLIAEAPVGIARLDRRDARGAIITEANPAFVRIAGAGVGSTLLSRVASADWKLVVAARLNLILR
jgi:two-component system, cell cycle sensor histidine kinase and response regulator CckA